MKTPWRLEVGKGLYTDTTYAAIMNASDEVVANVRLVNGSYDERAVAVLVNAPKLLAAVEEAYTVLAGAVQPSGDEVTELVQYLAEELEAVKDGAA